MSARRSFLDDAYRYSAPEETEALYGEWAATYDDEIERNGYATPARTAAAMAACVEDLSAPLLDLGCGTGLSGRAFREAGFTAIDGTDFSQEMLDAAGAKAVYGKLTRGDLNRPVPARPGDYANMAAVGVISPGHAPPELMATALDLLPAGGCFGFSLNDHALEDEAYEGQMHELIGRGDAELAFQQYGDHLPGIGVRAKVYVLRRV